MEEHTTRAEIAYHNRLLSARPARPRFARAPPPPAAMPAQSTAFISEQRLSARAQSPSDSDDELIDTGVTEGEKQHVLCWHCSKVASQLKVCCFSFSTHKKTLSIFKPKGGSDCFQLSG